MFWTYYRLYKYKILSFRLTNRLITFQYYINKIFIEYLDNILIYLSNFLEYNKHVRKVLLQLYKVGLYLIYISTIYQKVKKPHTSILYLNTYSKTFTVSYFFSYCLYKHSRDREQTHTLFQTSNCVSCTRQPRRNRQLYTQQYNPDNRNLCTRG